MPSETCTERIFDRENLESNMAIWNTYGSELAGDFGTKPCGKPTVWGQNYCWKHKKERRVRTEDRRKPQTEEFTLT